MNVSSDKTSVTQTDIEKGLRDVGLKVGDVVMVHSSLKSFGKVENGADSVIDALLSVLGRDGTLVMPTFTWDSFHNKTAGVFDIANTPSETGIITEVFRKRKGVLRSSHICHSVAAYGAHAIDVLGDGISPFARNSPFERLYDLNASILLLGVSFNACTALHAVEEQMQVPYRYYRDFKTCTVIWPDGHASPSQSLEFLRKPGYVNDFGKMGGIFEEKGVLRTVSIGQSPVTTIPVRKIIDITTQYMKDDIYFLLTGETRPH